MALKLDTICQGEHGHGERRLVGVFGRDPARLSASAAATTTVMSGEFEGSQFLGVLDIKTLARLFI